MAKRDGGMSLAATTTTPGFFAGAIVTLIKTGTNAMPNSMICYLTKKGDL